jgi:large subunit ribosomal protein L15
MNLSQLKPPAGQVKKGRRLGQGMGSGRGKFAGRGAKGAKSISGYSRMRGFEGGQMPLHRRLPKRGFSNAPFKTEYATLNVSRLEALSLTEITPESLKSNGVVKNQMDGIKILGNGEITRKLTVRVHAISESAKAKIEKAGGSVELIAARAPYVREKKQKKA